MCEVCTPRCVRCVLLGGGTRCDMLCCRAISCGITAYRVVLLHIMWYYCMSRASALVACVLGVRAHTLPQLPQTAAQSGSAQICRVVLARSTHSLWGGYD